MIDERAVPDGFDHAVAQPENEQVLRGFLTEVVIDSIDLTFRHGGRKDYVQFTGGRQTMPERLLDNDPPP